MRNLLFSLNLIPLLWILGSCGEQPDAMDKSENIDASSASISSSPDTLNPVTGESLHPCDSVAQPASSTISSSPDSSGNMLPRTNPRNTQGPNQQEVDSLKQLKTKGKKGDL